MSSTSGTPATSSVSFTVRRPTPTSRATSTGADSDESSFKVPALPRHLTNGSKPGSPLARSVPPSPKRKTATFYSSDEEEEHIQDELVTGFDQFGVQRCVTSPLSAARSWRGLSGSQLTTACVSVSRVIPEKEKQGPMVIAPLQNRDWREAGTGADGSVGGLGTRDAINSGPVLQGLQMRSKRTKVEVVESDSMIVEKVEEEDVKVEEISEDQRALRALLAGATGEGAEEGPIIDIIPSGGDVFGGRHPTEDDAFQQDIDTLPDVATLNDYERVPVSQFGARASERDGLEGGASREQERQRPRRALASSSSPCALGYWREGERGARRREPDQEGQQTAGKKTKLPKLPIPDLEDTCRRYLTALEGLQDPTDHEHTRHAVEQFLNGEGPRIQEKLKAWAEKKDRYESYLSHSDPVVLALNPFFVLENDPTPDRGAQLPRAAALIVSSLGFIHDLRAGILSPDTARGTLLDMDQYTRLFGTARIPTMRGCKMVTSADSRHIVVLRRAQFYWFDVLDHENRPVLTEREIQRNLQAILSDADKLPISEVARHSIGVLSTENRKIWSGLRDTLSHNRNNASCLEIVDNALFVVCLDDAAPENLADLCHNFLCGSYGLSGGVQVGTCTNRWYDKLQIIVCADGAAGINFEHTGVDGHTVLRFAADIFTEGLMLLARSINPSAPTLFHAPLSLYAKSYKLPRGAARPTPPPGVFFDTAPKKLEWMLTPELRAGIRFAETRLSDLICQNDCQALEFKGYGKNFITSHGFSPDAFVQMAFQAAYFGLYGRIECTYEPAMTKAFLHGRTEAIRTVQPPSVEFVKVTFFSEAQPSQKISVLRKACEHHVKLTKACSQGLGQDRHLYALYCLLQREASEGTLDVSPDDTPPSPSSSNSGKDVLPLIFTDPGWSQLNTSILSTSNCGNPALRLFGFGPVAADGYGIGYIIKDDGISVCASSKHLQTRRFLDTLQGYLYDVQRILIQLHRAANERPAPFVDHGGILRDSKTGRPINGLPTSDTDEDDPDTLPAGYSFFDSDDVDTLGRGRSWSAQYKVGRIIPLAEY
ncbi:hypothetical protein EWM64_g2802 [Hericium alpestre]|uniref:Choline/carnitine acyltransferase domain-containing protein n=1 Tax=Hericium alpestre TaxID=135208 RepID=A0A4Z0A4G2_9AGAM|nr:hypothetical protein EWM64_g2802 [Hericium alpestre]